MQDGHGHGTHCIGTALGAKCPGVRPRYGVAHDAEIFAGKVLSNAGSGSDTGILAGIEWAIQNKCAVISMSLGAATRPGQAFSQVYERVAKRAQEQGTLIIAAAGNESNRPGVVNPVGHPANCPSIMAVAAMDVHGAVARFSNSGINPDGGQIDIAGPGVDVHSSWPLPTRYRRISGTSMATPHVAGIAALYAEADPSARGAALARALTGGAQRLGPPLHRRRRGDGAGALIDVTILVADEHIDGIDDVAAALQDAGLRLDATLPATGVISGAVADAAAMQSLSAVAGVAAVEPVQEIALPPPDADVQ